MWKAGLSDYEEFGRHILAEIDSLPVSFEVFADAPREMRRQAERRHLGRERLRENPRLQYTGRVDGRAGTRALHRGREGQHTAMFTLCQVTKITFALADSAPSYRSVFAGRIADSGVDPVPIMREALELMRVAPRAELIWASPHELLNLVQADQIGCHIMTMTHDLLAKLPTLGKDLEAFSLETVRMIHRHAEQAGFEV
jgi:transaldolase